MARNQFSTSVHNNSAICSRHKNEGKSSSKNNLRYFVNSGGRMFYVGLSNEERAK